MKKFRAAVNFVPETGNNVLIRIKELGNKAPSMRVNRSIFKDVPPTQHESFIIEMEGVAQLGNYLIPTGACKIIDREVSGAVEFDVDAYMESLLKEDAPF